MKPPLPAVAYLRVSTRSQGESGLGIEAQRKAVDDYCRSEGYRVTDEFLEIESGGKNARPVLREAIRRARGTRALLLIARLDRLTRSLYFLELLLEGQARGDRLRFAACDLPSANPLILRILAAIAEEEAKAISVRTRAAMAAAKARGAVFGTPANLTREAAYRGGRHSAVRRREIRDRILDTVRDRIRELRSQRLGYAAIARELNDDGYTSARSRWNAKQVWRAAKILRIE